MSWRSSVSPASAFCRRLVVGHSTRPVPCALRCIGHRTCSRTLCSRHSFETYSTYCNSDTQKHRHLQLTSRQNVRSAAYFHQLKSALCSAIAEPATPSAQHAAAPDKKQLTMDYTALVASVQELKDNWIPAKVEQVGFLGSDCSTTAQHQHLLWSTLALVSLRHHTTPPHTVEQQSSIATFRTGAQPLLGSCRLCKVTSNHCASGSGPWKVRHGCTSAGIQSQAECAQGLPHRGVLQQRHSLLVCYLYLPLRPHLLCLPVLLLVCVS